MPTTYTAKTLVYKTIWDKLNASTPFTTGVTAVKTQVSLLAAVLDPLALNANKGTSNFPQACLLYTPGSYDDGSTRSVYGRPQPQSVKVKELSIGFALTLTFAGVAIAVNDVIEAAVLDALSDATSELGLVPTPFAYCQRSPIRHSPAFGFVTDPTGQGGQRREQTVFDFSVTVRWQGGGIPTLTI